MRRLILLAYVLAAFGTLPGTANATCGEECDAQYSSNVDDCHSNYGEDPADADDLTNCIQEARNNYRSCLDDCASAAITIPRPRKSILHAFSLSFRDDVTGTRHPNGEADRPTIR